MASDLRSDVGRVSGRRSHVQISGSKPYSISTTNTPRHCVSSITACPSDGATTGTEMKIIIANDITLAIRRPA